MKALAVAALLAASFAFACGGDDDDSNGNGGDNTGGTGGSSTPVGGAAGVLTAAAGGRTPSTGGTGGSSSIAAKTAVVTIGDERFEFNLNRDCRALFGALVGDGVAADGSDIRVNMQVPPEGGIADVEATIRVDDKVKDVDWRAGGDVIGELAGVSEGDSQVDTYTNDGKRASGTATFLNMYDVLKGEVKPVKGTFEFACE